MGLASAGFVATNYLGSNLYSGGIQPGTESSNVSTGFTSVNAPTGLPASGDVWALAVDFSSGNVWIAQNSVWLNGNPATGTTPTMAFVPATVGALFPGLSFNLSGNWPNLVTLQSTAASQKYAPPSGFSAWDGGTAPPPTSVWSAADAAANGMTLSNGGLTVTSANGSGYGTVRGTISQTGGKLYIEFLMSGGAVSGGGDPEFGLASAGFIPTSYLGTSNYSMGLFTAATALNIGSPSADFTSNYLSGFGTVVGDIVGLAVDLAAGKIWMADNNGWVGGGNPATGANPMGTFVPPLAGQAFFPAITLRTGASGSGVWTLQSTAASQKYAPPSGFSAWDSAPPSHSPQAPTPSGPRLWTASRAPMAR